MNIFLEQHLRDLQGSLPTYLLGSRFHAHLYLSERTSQVAMNGSSEPAIEIARRVLNRFRGEAWLMPRSHWLSRPTPPFCGFQSIVKHVFTLPLKLENIKTSVARKAFNSKNHGGESVTRCLTCGPVTGPSSALIKLNHRAESQTK